MSSSRAKGLINTTSVNVMYEYVTADIAGTQTVRSLVLREGFKMLQKKSQ